MNQTVRAVQMPVRVWFIPPAVEPDAGDLSIAGEQLAELIVHESEIAVPVAAFGTAGGLACASTRIVVGMMPIELRMVEKQLDSLAMALIRQHFQRVLLIRRGVHDIPTVLLRAPHCEAVVMLARDRDVLHARGFGERHPFGGIEF